MKLVMDDAGYTPTGYFGIEALIDFSFDLGGMERNSATARNVFFGGSWEVVPGGPLVSELNQQLPMDAGTTVRPQSSGVIRPPPMERHHFWAFAISTRMRAAWRVFTRRPSSS